MNSTSAARSHPLSTERSARAQQIDSIGWAPFFIWGGFAMLAQVPWEWFLLGVGVLILASDVARQSCCQPRALNGALRSGTSDEGASAMRTFVVVGAAIAGGVIAFRCLSRASRDHLKTAVGHWIKGHMERMMASFPESAPPKLVMSVLPRVREQNDQIIAMLRE